MPNGFISSSEEIRELRDSLDAQGRKLILTNGVFDLLHVGHVRYLNEAKSLGDCLVVAINADESVRELKGPNRPVYSAEERAEILCALEAVDRVVVFSERRASRVIEAIHPHIYTKGGDYTPDSLIDEEKQLLDRLGVEIRILSLVAGKSTSATVSKMEATESEVPKIAILGSGKGSNASAIIEAIEDEKLAAEVAVVLSDEPDAGILEIARQSGIAAIPIDPGTEKAGQLTDAAIKEIQDRLEAANVELVVLAGFMRIIREPLLSAFPERIVNIHPSLLPKFPGLQACQKALDAGEMESGCTIHLVDAGVDTGKILRQEVVPIQDGDTVESLQARIQMSEHQAYPEVIAELLLRD